MTRREQRDIYQEVTDRIIDALDRGVVPWRQPWRSLGLPRNLNSGRVYRGINPFMLQLEALAQGYTDPRWATFNGIKKAGGSVRKGQHGTRVVFWKRIQVEDKEQEDGKKWIPLLRDFTVFNVEQADWPEGTLPALTDEQGHSPIHEAESIIREYVEDGGPGYREAGDRAYYDMDADAVTVPPLGHFDTPESFYSAAFHELAHSTGHESRLDRLDRSNFGSEPYAQEELVAEMGAAMLCGIAGIETTVEASASYIASWLGKLRSDKKLAVSAARQAQKAADLIQGTTFEESNEQAAVAAGKDQR